MDTDLASLRNEYSKSSLDRKTVDKDPLLQFRKWLSEAISAEVNEPAAMTLATSGADGRPSARVVLLKDVNETGLTFFTNYESKKGKQLKENPQAALVFFWPSLRGRFALRGR
jgi:pyridoxamine 5'-phosphate oxidase